MSLAQTRVTTFIAVRRRPTPVLNEKQRQPFACAGQIVMVGVQRPQHVVLHHAFVEAIDQANEEFASTNFVIEHGHND
jgi:hypothetical protein